ncbi:MAG: endonuclease, partial [Actinomycetes bacterium]
MYPFCPSPPLLPARRPAPLRAGVVHGRRRPRGSLYGVRLVIAHCSVDYVGRLKAHLPLATRLLLVKADGSVLVHS